MVMERTVDLMRCAFNLYCSAVGTLSTHQITNFSPIVAHLAPNTTQGEKEHV